MARGKRVFTSSFKAQVALEALKERESLAELAKRFEIAPNMIARWKQEFIEHSSEVFEKGNSVKKEEVDIDKLYAKIGQLEMEREFLKKNLKKASL
jgi:transposase-like protein